MFRPIINNIVFHFITSYGKIQQNCFLKKYYILIYINIDFCNYKEYNCTDYDGMIGYTFSEIPNRQKVLQGHAMKKFYRICKKSICIDAEHFPGDNPLWRQFEAESSAADISVSCKISVPFPETSGGIRAGEFTVSVDGDTVYRALPMGTVDGALTKYTPADTSHSETFFTPRSFPIMMDSRYMWSSVSLPQLLLPHNAFFIHSSFISINGKAVLFSAPCGVGKSTQAALWEKHRNAEVINGDKAGVLVENGVYACGVPFCGTSGICKNRTFPLGAIVLLSQSPENNIKRLAGIEAMRAVMQNIYLDLIAPNEQKTVIDLLIELLKTVPVYSLGCTADENAVITLENELRSGGVI